nr:hemerythrin domain-containing protein [Geobacter sp. FeAm09]
MHFPEELLFGIPEIDGQHRDLFDMYNEFSDAVDKGRGPEGLSLLFDRLEGFAAYHFRCEERLMVKSGYPQREEHLQEHTQSNEVLKQYKAAMDSAGVTRELLLSIKRHLIRLLINHTRRDDLLLCRHLLTGQAASGPDVPPTAQIGEILVDAAFISRDTLKAALARQQEGGRTLGEVLTDMGAVTAEDMVEAFAIQRGLLKINHGGSPAD